MSAPGERATPSLGTTVKAWLLLRLLRRAAPRPADEEEAGPVRDRELPSTPRAEALVALLLLAGGLCAGGFVVFYVVFDNTQLLGLCLGLALVLLGIAAATAGKRVVPQEQHAEPYHDFGDEQAVEEVTALVKEGLRPARRSAPPRSSRSPRSARTSPTASRARRGAEAGASSTPTAECCARRTSRPASSCSRSPRTGRATRSARRSTCCASRPSSSA